MMTESNIIGIMVLLSICVTGAIRTLKDGPMMGPDGRQYKTAFLPRDNLKDEPQSRVVPVQVRCTAQSMIVFIRADLYSNGRQVTAKELHLGRSTENCEATPYSDTEYVIEADLHMCGSEISIEGDHLVYSNLLIYTPVKNSVGIVRTSGAAVPIECHYKRTHFVSSTDVKPTWKPLTSTKAAMEFISFSFKLMNDDWRTKRSSYVYHLGDVMNIQASFLKEKNASFRLIMDSCVATLQPDIASVPRYVFVQNHGCLIDSKTPGSSARFMPRKQNHVLQMQMDAFSFYDDHRNSIYITCHLKIHEVNIMNKACTYSGQRWLSVDDGTDDVCECCESTCDVNGQKQMSKWSRLPKRSINGDSTLSNILMIGPISVLR